MDSQQTIIKENMKTYFRLFSRFCPAFTRDKFCPQRLWKSRTKFVKTRQTIVITSAEREVKDSRRSGMLQNWYFWDKIWRSESRISSRYLDWDHFDFFDLFFNLFEEERIVILAFPGFEPTHLCDPSDQRRL